MPAWSDVSPSAISAHLKSLWVFKYDRVAGEFTARLAGTRAKTGFGKSFRGTPLKDAPSSCLPAGTGQSDQGGLGTGGVSLLGQDL
jgi:hypothetical protein